MIAIPSQSMSMSVSYGSSKLDITLDTGATVSYIRLHAATLLGLTFMSNDQLALLANKNTRMASMGEVDFIVRMQQDIIMRVGALMKNLQAACSGGTTFHADKSRTSQQESKMVKSSSISSSLSSSPTP
jgi:hypothetical protein